MSTTMFSKFHNLPLRSNSRSAEAPYCAEYASAVHALSVQIPKFTISRLEEVLIPALLLMIAEVRIYADSSMHSLTAHRVGWLGKVGPTQLDLSSL